MERRQWDGEEGAGFPEELGLWREWGSASSGWPFKPYISGRVASKPREHRRRAESIQQALRDRGLSSGGMNCAFREDLYRTVTEKLL